VGEEVQIPIFPVERVVFVPSIPVQNKRFPILSVLLEVDEGVSISYPMTMLLFPMRVASHALAQI
jgi:hypothetical protein